MIHQLRNSSKYVSYKDIKALMADLKKVYTAATEESALDTKLSEYTYNHIALLILAESDEEFESMYNEFVEEYNSYGPQTVVDAYNAAYAEIKANFAATQG